MTSETSSTGEVKLRTGSMSGALVEVAGLRVSRYRDDGRRIDLVRDVSFRVHPGEVVCLVGESGSGKSLSVRAAAGLLSDHATLEVAGTARFDGVDVLATKRSARRRLLGRRIGMVFQETAESLDPVMRIGAQVREAARRGDGDTGPASIDALLRRVGLPDTRRVARAYPHQLSGGMCQRVMIAMAIAAAPKLVIADEPTSALDVTVQAQILDLLGSLRRSGTAILLVTHDFGVAAALADRVVVLYAGRTVEDAPTADLIYDPTHPYTEGLLRAVPEVASVAAGKVPLASIEGNVPAPGTLTGGCAFEPRCAVRIDRCAREDPPLQGTGTRTVACWVRRAEGTSDSHSQDGLVT